MSRLDQYASVLALAGALAACGDKLTPLPQQQVLPGNATTTAVVPATVQKVITHTVQWGDTLTWISRQHWVSLENLLTSNQSMLDRKFLEICKRTSANVWKWCNAPAHSIKPWMEIVIPTTNGVTYNPSTNTLTLPSKTDSTKTNKWLDVDKKVPEPVRDILKRYIEPVLPTDKIAVVIDVSWSMSEDRDTVTDWMASWIWWLAKGQTTFYTYSEQTHWPFDNPKNVDFNAYHGWGGTENVHSAIQKAIRDWATKVIVITDEAWDDWPRVVEEPKNDVKVITLLLNQWINCRWFQVYWNKWNLRYSWTWYTSVGTCIDVKPNQNV